MMRRAACRLRYIGKLKPDVTGIFPGSLSLPIGRHHRLFVPDSFVFVARAHHREITVLVFDARIAFAVLAEHLGGGSDAKYDIRIGGDHAHPCSLLSFDEMG